MIPAATPLASRATHPGSLASRAAHLVPATSAATDEAGFDAALAHIADALHAHPTATAIARRANPRRAGGAIHWLVDAEGRRTALPVERWHGPPEPAVQDVIDRCAGPTVDVGCGPGRLTTALALRGVIALGIDTSAVAVRLTRRRGGAALRRDVFAPLPGEGRWSHALLMDGNIGIGGDPAVLLCRCADLLRRGGTVLVELDQPGAGLWRGNVRVARAAREVARHPGSVSSPETVSRKGSGPHTDSGPDGDLAYCGPPFRWARLGVDVISEVAAEARLVVRRVFCRDRRWFAELER
jgi:SAM-dependent methyltransferase